MQKPQHNPPNSVWLPFGLPRIDGYYVRTYLKAFFLILLALAALVAIGDLFQRFDDFVLLSRRENQEFMTMIMTFLRYYASFVPQLIFQYMFPVTMLLAASIVVTSSFSGPRGNNEYIVIRSAGIPAIRAFMPLLVPALCIAILFQIGRDFFLPGMVRESAAITNRLKSRTSNPTSVSLIGPDGDYQWVPLKNARVHQYTSFARRESEWTTPVPTSMTPAMIERQTLGDSVSTWRDLFLLRSDNAGARFEIHWRLADPLCCVLLILWGTGTCMGLMLRGRSATFIHSVSVSMVAAVLFYVLRLLGRTAWENGLLSPIMGVWAPVGAAALVALAIALWMEN